MEKLQAIPLGGIGEFGMNCLALRCGGEMIIIDAGLGFPEESAYGVDIAIPDFSFLEDYRSEMTALFLTHGHEDHIGAVPFFLKQYNLPVYGSRFTLELVAEKLDEHDIIDDVLLHRVEQGDIADTGLFQVEFIHATHSLVDCFSLAIDTPAGTVVHTGDYKIDDSPVIGRPYDVNALQRRGDDGVLVLFSDSTNATVPGRTPSEQDVIPDIESIIEEAEGRLFFTTFSSSIHRIQIVFDLAREFGRSVCVLGRSMLKNVRLAEELGLLDAGDGVKVGLEDAQNMPDREIVYLATGSQGESRAVLWNLATQSYKGLSIRDGDTVVISARIIPGNEKRISKMIGAIYRRGGTIIEEKRRLIHVSGHASQEDIRIMTEAVRPRFVVPIHGESRMLFRHKEYLKNHLGYSEGRVVLFEDGDTLEIDRTSVSVLEQNEVGRVFIDGLGLEPLATETVRERKKLGYNGVVSVSVVVDASTGALEGNPTIRSSGFTLSGKNGLGERELDAFVRDNIAEAVNGGASQAVEELRVGLRRYIRRETGARPEILVSVVEV